ncbi:MAG: hypothetical protein ABIP79_16250, partial [Chitinophagaceae bacterium]
MEKNKSYYNLFRKVSAVAMITALVWLTISAPFVFHFQQELKKMEKTQATKSSAPEKGDTNPFASTTEEKTPSVNTFSEEYLHHSEENILHKNIVANQYSN